jgi:hypothetical protein
MTAGEGSYHKDSHHPARTNPYLFSISERDDLAFFTFHARMFLLGFFIGAPKLFLFRQYSQNAAAGF